LREFNAHYVIVGDTERATYMPEGLSKFDQLCAVAFQSGTSTVYQCE
jgi:hypothetical protein